MEGHSLEWNGIEKVKTVSIEVLLFPFLPFRLLNHTLAAVQGHLSTKEILTKYRLHIFVTIIFLITLLFVSLGWYYRDKTREEDLSNLKIFIDPRNRILTLSDHQDEVRT